MKTPRQCLDCGRDMTLEEWYPEMLCETCKQKIDSAFQEIDSAFTNKNRQEGLGYPDECY